MEMDSVGYLNTYSKAFDKINKYHVSQIAIYHNGSLFFYYRSNVSKIETKEGRGT